MENNVISPSQVLELNLGLSQLGEIPLLFTFRTAKEGGEKDISKEEYVALNKTVISTGNADLVDVELFMGQDILEELVVFAHENGVKVIASNHDFEKTPAEVEMVSRLCEMQKLGADILKIAVMPRDKEDVVRLLAATEEMRSQHATQPLVTMSMSSQGIITRIAGEAFGSAITFGAAGKTSAPGQLPVDELKQVLTILHNTSGC